MKKAVSSLLLFTLFILLLLFPDIVKSGAQDGLFLWYRSIVPILFPFIILSNTMMAANSFSWLLQPFFLLNKYIKICNPWYFYAIFLGLFCGYPMGAKAVSDLVITGKISVREGEMLLPIVNQASPMFLAGYLGVHIFEKSIPLGKIIYILYLPPVFFFLFLQILTLLKKEKTSSHHFASLSHSKKNSMSQSMEHTIWNSFHIIVSIGIYMMLFTIVMQLLHILLPKSPVLAVGTCFLEFSAGLNELKHIRGIFVPLKNALLFALTSFGGFCTVAQTSSIIENTGISMKKYLFWKAILAFFVFLLAYASFISS